MTLERIAELRQLVDEARKETARAPDGYRGCLPDHVGMHYLEADELLDLAEASGKIAELLQAGTICTRDCLLSVRFETADEAIRLSGLLVSMSPSPSREET